MRPTAEKRHNDWKKAIRKRKITRSWNWQEDYYDNLFTDLEEEAQAEEDRIQDEITRRGIKWRHTRVRRPNDNAHVERFNRTLREECLGNYIPTGETLEQTQQRTEQYLDFYNTKRLHLGIQFMTPLEKCSQGLELN